MSIDMLLEKQVKCRKDHLCIWCGETIKAGEIVPFRKYIFEGMIQRDYYHPECNEVMLALDWYDEGFDAYIFKRGTEEFK
ncbi:hypothetical protein ES705_38394 [subsurface metagenome]